MFSASPNRVFGAALLACAIGGAPGAALQSRGEAPADLAVESAGPDGFVLKWTGTGPPGLPSTARLAVWLGDVVPDEACRVAGQPSMLGTVVLDGDRAAFRPRLPLRAGQAYTACLAVEAVANGRGDALWSGRIAFEAASNHAPQGPPRVISVWPPSDEPVPANLLRFYVEFDQPMRAASVDRAVQLISEGGEPIADALVPIPEGLWDRERRRLTVTLHPGRIKQGVGPRRVQGPVVEAGATFDLRIGPELRSASGLAVVPSSFRYVVGAADRVPPDPESWGLEAPRGAAGVARLVLDERVDPAVLRRAVRLLEIERPEGVGSAGVTPVDVGVEIDAGGRSLRLWPSSGVWRPGRYRLEILGVLEDLAGNRPGRLFDAPLSDSAPPTRETHAPRTKVFEFEVFTGERGTPAEPPR